MRASRFDHGRAADPTGPKILKVAPVAPTTPGPAGPGVPGDRRLGRQLWDALRDGGRAGLVRLGGRRT